MTGMTRSWTIFMGVTANVAIKWIKWNIYMLGTAEAAQKTKTTLDKAPLKAEHLRNKNKKIDCNSEGEKECLLAISNMAAVKCGVEL